jgi:ATP-dependent Clp protease ATP-binding subunit ClpA
MARVIQQVIKTPLADEVLFGRLKNGGTVRVVVVTEESGIKKLGFLFPEGPVLPRPERDIVEAGKKRVRPEPEVRRAKSRRLKGEGGEDEDDLDDDASGDESETVEEPDLKH